LNANEEYECSLKCPPPNEPTKILTDEGVCVASCPLYLLTDLVCVPKCEDIDPLKLGETSSYYYDTIDNDKGVYAGIRYCVRNCAAHTDVNGNTKLAFYTSSIDLSKNCTKNCVLSNEPSLGYLDNGECRTDCKSKLYFESNKVCTTECSGIEKYYYTDLISGETFCTAACKPDQSLFFIDRDNKYKCISSCPPDALDYALLTRNFKSQCITDCDVFNFPDCTDDTFNLSPKCPNT
jgi:hypothetical protein